MEPHPVADALHRLHQQGKIKSFATIPGTRTAFLRVIYPAEHEGNVLTALRTPASGLPRVEFDAPTHFDAGHKYISVPVRVGEEKKNSNLILFGHFGSGE